MTSKLNVTKLKDSWKRVKIIVYNDVGKLGRRSDIITKTIAYWNSNRKRRQENRAENARFYSSVLTSIIYHKSKGVISEKTYIPPLRKVARLNFSFNLVWRHKSHIFRFETEQLDGLDMPLRWLFEFKSQNDYIQLTSGRKGWSGRFTPFLSFGHL